MKNLFIPLTALLFAFFLGCQSTITDPVVTDNPNVKITAEENVYVLKTSISAYRGVIKLEGLVFDPSHPLNSFAEIGGVIRYNLEERFFDPIPPAPQSGIFVDLYVDAELKGGCSGQQHPWTVKTTSQDMVYTSDVNASFSYLEKTFRVSNTCCAPLNLVFKFQVDEKALTLVSMSLKHIGGLNPIENQF
jgi:hypothetical protein